MDLYKIKSELDKHGVVRLRICVEENKRHVQLLKLIGLIEPKVIILNGHYIIERKA